MAIELDTKIIRVHMNEAIKVEVELTEAIKVEVELTEAAQIIQVKL